MNIVREQHGENNSLIRVTVGPDDYGQEVEKSLREYRRKANIPGFRPGMVPMGIIRKMYGKGVVAEQSYRTASNSVFEYLQKEGIDYLGDVIPAEEQGAFDFENNGTLYHLRAHCVSFITEPVKLEVHTESGWVSKEDLRALEMGESDSRIRDLLLHSLE